MPEEALPPGVTPDVWARAELARILASGLREAGRYRELHIELADLVRRYIELRFRIPARERTTSEIGEEMRLALIDEEITLLATALLARCDRVKFAKHVPQGGEIDETLGIVRRIIERTVPRETIAPSTGPASSEPAGAPVVGPA